MGLLAAPLSGAERSRDSAEATQIASVTEAEVNASVLGRVESYPLQLFVDADAEADPQYTFVGLNGLEVGALQDGNMVTFEARFGDSASATFLDGVPSWQELLLGPVPVIVDVKGAGVLGVRLTWDAIKNGADLCVPGGSEFLETKLRFFGGLDVFAMVTAGWDGVAAVGAEGRLRLFDLGLEQTSKLQMAVVENFAEKESLNDWQEVLGEIDCESDIDSLLAGPAVACEKLLSQVCDGNLETVDRLVKVRDQREDRVTMEMMGGSLSVFVELLNRRFSKGLITWRGKRFSGFRVSRSVEEEKDFFAMTAIGTAEDNMDFSPQEVEDILAWPFVTEGDPDPGESPLCPEE